MTSLSKSLLCLQLVDIISLWTVDLKFILLVSSIYV